MNTRILLAHSNPAATRPLVHALEREGHAVDPRRDGDEVLTLAPKVDLLVLDVDLPGLEDLNGLEVTRRLRADGYTMPILLLTGRTDEADVVMGLDSGADDYVAVPYRLAELLARVRALLRRVPGAGGDVQGVRVDAASRKVWLDDRELHVTVKEFGLLRILLREAGKVVTREQIMREVWDTEFVGASKTLDMHVSWLRRKLGDNAENPRYITTIRGVGFRFETGH